MTLGKWPDWSHLGQILRADSYQNEDEGTAYTNHLKHTTAIPFHIFISWLKHYVPSWKAASSIPDEVTAFFYWPNPSSCIMALGSTQPLTETRTRNFPGGKGRPAHKADILTAICETTVQKMLGPRRLTAL
jgi:hypothetical protein